MWTFQAITLTASQNAQQELSSPSPPNVKSPGIVLNFRRRSRALSSSVAVDPELESETQQSNSNVTIGSCIDGSHVTFSESTFIH